MSVEYEVNIKINQAIVVFTQKTFNFTLKISVFINVE